MMIDVREILESAEMDDVVRAVDALRKKFSLRPLYQEEHEWPVALARVGRLRASVVLNTLLSDKIFYPGYKDVLAAAFGGWLLVPHHVKLR